MSLASRPSLLHPAFAGWAALFSGLGLARFAFTPLLPAMIEAGWFSPGGGAAQGAANLAGYLLGAALMVAAALVTLKLGIAAERKSLEEVAPPLSSERHL